MRRVHDVLSHPQTLAYQRQNAPQPVKSFNRLFYSLLFVGVLIRSVALLDPLVDHGLLRQAQTAAATKGLIEQPGVALSSHIPWAGDLNENFILELPLYNYFVAGLFKITHQLDLSGKLVSIGLWAVSFSLLQGIWRRCLKPSQVFWANLLFVSAPLGVFYSQAFMPESLVQTLAFGFVLLILRHDEKPTLARWTACAATGVLALLVKLPETAHLYLILAFFVFRRERWTALRRPHYWVAALITVAALKLWGGYMDSTNLQWLPEWGSKENLQLFIGSLHDRLHLKPWIMIILYLGAFVVPAATAGIAAFGFWILARRERQPVLLLWFAGLALFYLVWFGNTAAKQGYYNIVALAPLSAVFGIGTAFILGKTVLLRWPRRSAVAMAIVTIACAVPGLIYLFAPDQRILAAARWAHDHTTKNDLIVFQPNHRWDMRDYSYNAVLNYYSDRATVVWTRNTPERYRRAALERGRYVIVTHRPPVSDVKPSRWLAKFRGLDQWKPQSLDWLAANGFTSLTEQDEFSVYVKTFPSSP